MAKFEIEGTKIICVEVEAENRVEAIRMFREQHKGFSVNGVWDNDNDDWEPIYAFCESCDDPVFWDAKFAEDEDGVVVCEKCGEGL